MAAVEIRVEGEGEIGEGPTTEQTPKSGLDEVPDGKRLKWGQVIPQVGGIVQIEWDVECMAVKEASQHHKGEWGPTMPWKRKTGCRLFPVGYSVSSQLIKFPLLGL